MEKTRMERTRTVEDLELRICELEQKIESLRFSRRVLLNLLEKLIKEQKPSKQKLIRLIPR